VSELPLTLLAEPLAMCQFPAGAAIPAWASGAKMFLTISRTPSELSIVADERAFPADVNAQRGYRAFRVQGPLPLDLIGIFASLAAPLADIGIAIFPIATFETDYLLVHARDLTRATAALSRAGHVITEESPR
jgi:hypothetical protein